MLPAIESIDLAPRLRALDARYAEPSESFRITGLAYCPSTDELYVQVGEGWLFVSRDGLRTLAEVREINRRDGEIVAADTQTVDFVVETLLGTILAIGRDRRDGAVVWRRARGAGAFERHVVPGGAWATTKSGNATAGYFGAERASVVAFVPYVDGNAHLFTSCDDGITWRRHDLSAYFVHHAHEAYLPRAVGNTRTARLWLTGGDDPSGVRSGLICFEGFAADGSLAPARWVVRERAGLRLVGLAGDGKHVYVGNESLAGGVLRLQDNAESIEAGDVEMCIGKGRHDYHQFRSLVVAADGLVVSGTDSYRQYAGDSVRGDAGGWLYVSTNGGASAVEVPLAGTWTTGVVCDGASIWFATSATAASGADLSVNALRVWRIPRPDPLVPLLPAYVAKVVIADSSRFYAWAGYAEHPQPILAPGERTMRVDMSCWPWVAVDILALADGTLAVEGLPYTTWRLTEDRWHDIATLQCRAGERIVLPLPEAARAFRHLRVRNAGEAPLLLESVAFVGRR